MREHKTDMETQRTVGHVTSPSAEAADFMVKILRIWQEAYKEMASSVEMPLNNSPASDSRSMSNRDHWNNSQKGTGRARMTTQPSGRIGNLNVKRTSSWFCCKHTHIVLQPSERYLSMKQVDRKSFIHRWKVQSFLLIFFVRYSLNSRWEEGTI